MAVTDAGIAHRAVPLWAKLLLATGFAVAGWLLSAMLGGYTASADEATTNTDDTAVQPAAQQGLLGLLNTTVTTLTNTVHSTVSTTVTTLTSTVNQVTAAVTTTTSAVVTPVTTALSTPVATTTKKTSTADEPATKVQTKADTTTEQVAAASAHAATEAPAPAAAPVHAAPAQPQTVKQREPVARQVVHAPVSATVVTVQPRDDSPAPAPASPAGQVCGISTAHDGGNHSKHPFAILGACTGTAPLAAIGAPRRDACEENSRDAALPTTSPD